MIAPEILQSAVRSEEDGTYWIITTPERYHRDIEPGSNQAFAGGDGVQLPGDLEIAVVISAGGEFLRWEPAENFQSKFE